MQRRLTGHSLEESRLGARGQNVRREKALKSRRSPLLMNELRPAIQPLAHVSAAIDAQQPAVGLHAQVPAQAAIGDHEAIELMTVAADELDGRDPAEILARGGVENDAGDV